MGPTRASPRDSVHLTESSSSTPTPSEVAGACLAPEAAPASGGEEVSGVRAAVDQPPQPEASPANSDSIERSVARSRPAERFHCHTASR